MREEEWKSLLQQWRSPIVVIQLTVQLRHYQCVFFLFLIKNCCMLFGYTRFRSFCPILFKPFMFWLRENQNFHFLIYIYIYIYCLIELSNYFVTIIINLSFGFYLFIYFYKNTKALLRRREIQYILSQSGFKHNRIFFYPSYKMRNTFGVLSQNMRRTILLSPYMTTLYSSEVSYFLKDPQDDIRHNGWRFIVSKDSIKYY